MASLLDSRARLIFQGHLPSKAVLLINLKFASCSHAAEGRCIVPFCIELPFARSL